MRCRKCNGLAVWERVVDVNEGLLSEQWRCLNCGELTYIGPLQSRVPVHTRCISGLAGAEKD